MNISKYGKASLTLLGASIAADLVTTGGVVTLASTAIGFSPHVLKTLGSVLKSVSPGLLTNQLTKIVDKYSEEDRSLEKAFAQAISNTLASVKKDFLSNKAYRVSLKDRLNRALGSGVPSAALLNQNILEDYYFQPLYRAFSDDQTIEKILKENQQLKPTQLIEEIIKVNKINLPDYQSDQQASIFKALTEGFNERFLHYFNEELKSS